MTIQIGNPSAVATEAQLRALRNDLRIRQMIPAGGPIVDAVRTSLNAGGDSVDQILGSIVVDPASLSGIRVGSMLEVYALWDVTSSANTKSLRLNFTAGAVGPVTIGAAAPTTNISTAFNFQFHIHDLNTIMAFPVISASGAGSAGVATLAQNSPNILQTGFTITLVGRWNSGSVAGSETIALRHAKGFLSI